MQGELSSTELAFRSVELVADEHLLSPLVTPKVVEGTGASRIVNERDAG